MAILAVGTTRSCLLIALVSEQEGATSKAHVFSVAVRYSLTPRFSEVHNRVYYYNRFAALLVTLTKNR